MALRNRKNPPETNLPSAHQADPGSSPTVTVTLPQKLARILNWDEIEEWQRDNKFILTGYVRSQENFKAVLASLGYIHNETGNIYTHLVPSVLFAISLIAIYDRVIPIDHSQATFSDHLAFIVFGLSFVVCLGLSAFFHTVKSHSHKVQSWGNTLDYLGICVLIAGSMVSILTFGFDDRPKERQFFTGLTLLLGTICGYISLNPVFKTTAYRPFRASMFVAYGLSGVLPIVYAIYTLGLKTTSERVALVWVLGEAFLYIFGAFLYGVLFPERWAPGTFDSFGHSHQLFHVCVVLAAGCHFKALIEAFNSSVIRR